MDRLDEYPYKIRPLTADKGFGFLIRYSDFRGCISDGETLGKQFSMVAMH